MTEERASVRLWPTDQPELIPLLPFVLTVWMDGVLTNTELRALGDDLGGRGQLTDAGKAELSRWLDPKAPLTPSEIQGLGSRIHAADLSGYPDATASITDLGLALWQAEGGAECCWTEAASVAALRGLEESLEILGAEAARRMARAGAPAPRPSADAVHDVERLGLLLAGNQPELRAEILDALSAPELTVPTGLSTSEHRERALEAVRYLARHGYGSLAFPAACGGRDDPGGAVAVFETLAYGDLSVVVKFGVQFGLFGGSVQHLGTEKHHETHLTAVGTMDLPGCYAMTETGHGSNVRDLETTATYDADTDELIVHTPDAAATKDYIGNAALHGQMATVFARLRVGDEDHGVHAVLVPIRDAAGAVLPGVEIEDRGLKLGLNGVDNGRIRFNEVRVPRDNLLDRFGRITDEATYESPIQSSGRRFFRMLGTLVAGRVSIAAASISATKVGLAIAVRYADGRRQFGPKAAPEHPILDYPLVQRALIPPLATTVGLHFLSQDVQSLYAAGREEDEAEIEVAAAGLKAYASDHCVKTLQACREACGGQGYIAENRFADLKADTDIFTTFEGANNILYQLVAKGLLSRFRDHMGHLNLWSALRYLGDRAEVTLTELNPVATRRTDPDHLRSDDFLRGALSYREDRLLRSAALRIRGRLRDGMDSFMAVTEVQDHLVALARAHVERRVFEAFQGAVAEAPEELRGGLSPWVQLCALHAIESDRGWFLEAGYIEPNKSRAIRGEIEALCHDLRDEAVSIVDAFAIPEHLLPALVRYSD